MIIQQLRSLFALACAVPLRALSFAKAEALRRGEGGEGGREGGREGEREGGRGWCDLHMQVKDGKGREHAG